MAKNKQNNTLLSKAKKIVVETVDQNDDGKLDSKDLSTISEKVQKSRAQKKRVADLKKLQPLFLEDIGTDEFPFQKFLRIANKDKAHKDNALCANSIGHITGNGRNKVITIYRNKLSKLGLTLYPDEHNDFYFIDPCDKNRYIELDSYFAYLKSMRLSELQKIAQDLGAKHFRITYKEKKVSFTKKKAEVSAQAKAKKYGSAKAEASRENETDSFSSINVEAEDSFPGSSPTKPKIKYLKHDPLIMNLIDMRLHKSSPLGKQKITIEFQNTCGMKERDAVKIDAGLKLFNASGNTKLTHEVQNEQRRLFEYEIEFPE